MGEKGGPTQEEEGEEEGWEGGKEEKDFTMHFIVGQQVGDKGNCQQSWWQPFSKETSPSNDTMGCLSNL